MLYGEAGLVEITSRTIQGRLLLRPSLQANDFILGVLGRAQRLYGVKIHAFTFLSNHFHLLMSVLSAQQMSGFCGYLKGNVAKELGALHGWKQTFWGKRFHHAEVALREEDQVSRLLYILRNGCKEGLVASPLAWPGVSSARALCRGESSLPGTWYDRAAQYRAGLRGENKLFPSIETVQLTPVPFLVDRSLEDQKDFYQEAVHEIEAETAQMHRENGTHPIGVRAILRRHPHYKPKELRSSPAPKFHASSREDFWVLQNARAAKLASYREAAARLLEGEFDVSFPEGCFPPPLPYVESRAPT